MNKEDTHVKGKRYSEYQVIGGVVASPGQAMNPWDGGTQPLGSKMRSEGYGARIVAISG